MIFAGIYSFTLQKLPRFRARNRQNKRTTPCGVVLLSLSGISPSAKIFARSDRERAPIALLAKCEPISKTQAFWVGSCAERISKTKAPHLMMWCFCFGETFDWMSELLILIILSILSNYPLYFFKNAVVDSLINVCYTIIKQGTYAEFSEGSNNNGNEYWK